MNDDADAESVTVPATGDRDELSAALANSLPSRVDVIDSASPRRRCPRVLEAVSSLPWAIVPGKLEAILDFIDARADLGLSLPSARGGRSAPVVAATANGVAVLPIVGTIAHRASLLDDASGGTSVQSVSRMLREAMADPQVGSIVLDIDSPGGSVEGIAELGDMILRARETKPIVAVANVLAASAAYWIASQASEIVASPSGAVGSIGVIATHDDVSRAMEARGVRRTLITAGKYKADGHPYQPLGDESRARIQAQVDGYYREFVDAVARGRGVPAADVASGFGEGDLVRPAEALRLGMIDRVATLSETIDRMASRPVRSGKLRADQAARRLALAAI